MELYSWVSPVCQYLIKIILDENFTMVSNMEGLLGANYCKGRDVPAVVWFFRVQYLAVLTEIRTKRCQNVGFAHFSPE